MCMERKRLKKYLYGALGAYLEEHRCAFCNSRVDNDATVAFEWNGEDGINIPVNVRCTYCGWTTKGLARCSALEEINSCWGK